MVLRASNGLTPFIWPKNVTNEAFSVRSHIKNSSPPPCGVGWFWFSRGSNTSIALASRSSRSSSSGSSTSTRGREGGTPPHGWQHGTRDHIYIYIIVSKLPHFPAKGSPLVVWLFHCFTSKQNMSSFQAPQFLDVSSRKLQASSQKPESSQPKRANRPRLNLKTPPQKPTNRKTQ